jgi:hypothetical protein
MATQSIQFDDLPGFLRNDGTSLDVKNPAITLELNNPLPVTFTAGLKLTNNKDEGNPVNIELDLEKGLNKFYIADVATEMPDGYTHSQADIVSLVRKLPDSLKMEVSVKTDTTQFQTIYLEDFKDGGELSAKYDINVPLGFGANFQIAIDTVFEFDEDISDYTKNASSLEIMVTLTNGLPLGLDLQITPVDINHNPIDGIEMKSLGEIPADKVTETSFGLTEKIAGSLGKLKALQIAIRAKGTPNGMLKPTQYVLLQLGVKVEGGITIDPDDM